MQWEPETFSLGTKGPGREGDHSSPSSAEVKNDGAIYTCTPHTSSWRLLFFSEIKTRDLLNVKRDSQRLFQEEENDY
jgi:hypothetical protein